MRKLIEASEHICTLGYDETSELDELLDKAEKNIRSHSRRDKQQFH